VSRACKRSISFNLGKIVSFGCFLVINCLSEHIRLTKVLISRFGDLCPSLVVL